MNCALASEGTGRRSMRSWVEQDLPKGNFNWWSANGSWLIRAFFRPLCVTVFPPKYLNKYLNASMRWWWCRHRIGNTVVQLLLLYVRYSGWCTATVTATKKTVGQNIVNSVHRSLHYIRHQHWNTPPSIVVHQVHQIDWFIHSFTLSIHNVVFAKHSRFGLKASIAFGFSEFWRGRIG